MGRKAAHLGALGMRVKAEPTEALAWLEADCSFAEDYELGRQLGKGSFGDVWSCRSKQTGKEFAAKVVLKASLTPESKAALKTEVSVLRQLKNQHQGVVQVQEVLESSKAVQVVMEMCKGGELFHLLSTRGRLPERSARLVFMQLASALAHCHSKGILHRDIKPENILFDQPAASLYYPPIYSSANPVPQAKFVDFGLACVLTPGETTTGCTGSRFYTAPEMVQGKKYGRRVDVWSLGVVLATMVTGTLPFSGKNPCDSEGLRRAIIKARVNFNQPCWFGVSSEARDLVSKMLQADPQKRPRASELLLHPWCIREDTKVRPSVSIPVTQSLDNLSLSSFSIISRTTTCTSCTSHSTDTMTLCPDSGLPSPGSEQTDRELPCRETEPLACLQGPADESCCQSVTERDARTPTEEAASVSLPGSSGAPRESGSATGRDMEQCLEQQSSRVGMESGASMGVPPLVCGRQEMTPLRRPVLYKERPRKGLMALLRLRTSVPAC